MWSDDPRRRGGHVDERKESRPGSRSGKTLWNPTKPRKKVLSTEAGSSETPWQTQGQSRKGPSEKKKSVATNTPRKKPLRKKVGGQSDPRFKCQNQTAESYSLGL